jgi:hypothetical protein
MLGGPIKLAGPTINCEGAGEASPAGGAPWVPHVQSYAAATDADGLSRLLSASPAFHCHSGRLEAIASAEIGMSQAVLSAGLDLDSFQLK